MGGGGGGGGGGGLGEGVCSLANYSVAYKETQSNRVSDFRYLCVLCFQRQLYYMFHLIYHVHVHLNPFMSSGLFYINSLDRSISNRRDVRLFLV